jgi:outer membrane cobalamin receptor
LAVNVPPLKIHSGDQSRSGTTEGYRTAYDALVKYEYDKLKIQAEYIYRKQTQTSDGWYLMAAAYLSPKLQAGVRYEQAVANGQQTLLTTGVNYFFDPNIKFMVNYLI